jgi:hypothetical protein
MTHIFDTKNKVWDSAKDGTIRAFETETEVPVTVYLQWFEGGWNRIYEVRIGAVNAGGENRILAEEIFGASREPIGWSVANITEFDSNFAKGTLKPKSPYFSDIPIEFLERVPTLVAGLQRDIEGTRQAVQLLRDEVKCATTFGSLGSFWQEAEHSDQAIVAYRLKELLYQAGVVAFRNEAFRLLDFKDTTGKPISLRSFARLLEKGERLFLANNKKKEGKK